MLSSKRNIFFSAWSLGKTANGGSRAHFDSLSFYGPYRYNAFRTTDSIQVTMLYGYLLFLDMGHLLKIRQSKKLRRGGVAEPFGHDERLKKYKLRQYAREPTTRDNSVGLGYLTCSQQLSDRGAQPQYRLPEQTLPAENLRSTLVNTPGVPEEQQKKGGVSDKLVPANYGISDSLITVDEWLRERIGMSLQATTWTFAIKRDSGEIVYHCIVIANITEHITLFILHSSICQVRSVALSLFVTQRINRPDGKRLVSNLQHCSCGSLTSARPEQESPGNEDNEYNVQRAVVQINEL
ncbi:hypothetical protein G5I_11144 [Acromyrmex echinatior]|uniref:Uncharacterized protein n=1 Tax=Acromyrmex echinatior TaxID=103372 RepID=F4WYT0_ACREC|nr:hypothetical protein G5I_11144 [Acromyrmex echinatior]